MQCSSYALSPRVRRSALWLTLVPLVAAAACEDPQPPTSCGAIPATTVHAGETATTTACFTDPNGDALTYSAASSNPSVATAAAASQTVTVSAVAPGDAVITVTARDPGGLQAEQSFSVTVPNRAPTVRGAIPAQHVLGGQTIALDVAAYFNEPDGETLTYTAVSSNSAVTTVAVTGSSVQLTGVARGTADVTVTATDPSGLAATQAFRVTVPNGAPVAVGTVPAQTVVEGKSTTINAAEYFDDPDGDVLTYSAATTSPAVASATVTGSAVTIAGESVGGAAVTVTARDPEGLTATQSFGVTVTEPPNRAPQRVGSIPGQTMGEGGSAMVDVKPYFTDPDGDDLNYTASTSDAGVASIEMQDGIVRITGAGLGEATVTATATDPDGLSADQEIPVSVEQLSRDRRILTDFYNAADGADWDNSGNWLRNADLGTWYGVSVNDSNQVTHLELIDNRVATITAGLGGLEQLVRLDLSENYGMDGRIPRQLGDLENLEWLDLSGSFFFARGTLPPELGKLKKLKRLDLSETIFWVGDGGPIPSEFGDMESLERLDVRQARLEGPLPSSLGKLTKLTWLDLSWNGFTGEIPRSFMDLNLKRFHWNLNLGLCAPADEEFQAWVATIEDHDGPTCAASGPN